MDIMYNDLMLINIRPIHLCFYFNPQISLTLGIIA